MTYYGEAESDSKSIIPAICKANKTNYLGADAYTHMIYNNYCIRSINIAYPKEENEPFYCCFLRRHCLQFVYA